MIAQFLQSNSHKVTSGSTNSVSYTSNCTAGSMLFAVVMGDNASTYTMSVADGTNGTWIPIGSMKLGTGALAAFGLQMFYLLGNTSTTTLTVTATLTGGSVSTYLAVGIGEYTGVKAPDSYSYANTTASQTTPSLTIVEGAVVIAVAEDSGTPGIVEPNFMTRENANLGSNTYGDYVAVSTEQNPVAATTGGGTGVQVQGIVSFPPSDTQTPLGYVAGHATGGNTDTNTSGTIVVSGYYVYGGGTIDYGMLYCQSLTNTASGSVSAAVRLVMFADNGGIPHTTAVAVTDEVVVNNSSNQNQPSEFWMVFPGFTHFGGQPALAAGNYWVGYWQGTIVGSTTLQIPHEESINLPPDDQYYITTATYSSTASAPTVSAWTDSTTKTTYSLYFNSFIPHTPAAQTITILTTLDERGTE